MKKGGRSFYGHSLALLTTIERTTYIFSKYLSVSASACRKTAYAIFLNSMSWSESHAALVDKANIN